VKFFEAAFMNGFAESIDNTMKLPDDSPDAFSMLINYVYRGSIPKCPITRDSPHREKREYVFKMLSSYILGEKLCVNEFMNLIMDDLGTGVADDLFLTIPYAAYAYENTYLNSRLRRFIAFDATQMINFEPIPEVLTAR
jgi:hypothetical protein